MIDLKTEQTATLNRPRPKYSLAARSFFWIMDLLTGKGMTLSKIKLIEILASIPYRSWETRQYEKLTRHYKEQGLVDKAIKIMEWSREAQDNEYWHLLLVNEKMKADNIKDAWYLFPLIPFIMVQSYGIMSWFIALVNIEAAFLFNSEFEDHAEHVYAQFVKDFPELEDQKVESEIAKGYGDHATWADVFRRIGLDERDHRNLSFVFAGKPEEVVKYEGMNEIL